jgi:hypothetical protein
VQHGRPARQSGRAYGNGNWEAQHFEQTQKNRIGRLAPASRRVDGGVEVPGYIDVIGGYPRQFQAVPQYAPGSNCKVDPAGIHVEGPPSKFDLLRRQIKGSRVEGTHMEVRCAGRDQGASQQHLLHGGEKQDPEHQRNHPGDGDQPAK